MILSQIKNFFVSFLKKWPSKSQWRRIFEVLTKREKIILALFFISFLTAFSFLLFDFYLKNTEIQPAFGGDYTEGVLGHPRFINPIYANSDVDRDLVELIYSGLMKYDENGKIIPDLAKNYEIKEEGTIYEFHLKENVFWSDGLPLTSEDLIFTIKTIQNPDYKSPFRANWLGVKVEKIDDLSLRFELKNSYSPFLENLTLKIMPKHIWQDIPPQNFPLAIYNLRPVGSGPYKLKEFKQDQQGFIKSLILIANPKYFGERPYIPKINFFFFDEEKELIEAANQGKIEGFSLTAPRDLKNLNNQWEIYRLSLPRYFALFFNPEKS